MRKEEETQRNESKGLKSIDEGLKSSRDQDYEIRAKRVVILDQGFAVALQVQLCVMQLQSTSVQV